MSWYEPLLWAGLAVVAIHSVWAEFDIRDISHRLASAEAWADIWRERACEMQDKADQLRVEQEALQLRNTNLQELYAERTQVALWAGVTRFLMN